MKISIIYHSQTGSTEKMAQNIAEGARLDGKVDVKLMNLDEVDQLFVEQSAAVVIGCPTHRGTFSWPMKKWIGTTRIKLAGKLGSVFVTEGYLGGGAEIAELGLIGHLLVLGMLVYSSGVSEGQPYIHYGAVALKEGDEAQKERARIFGARIARKALELFDRQ